MRGACDTTLQLMCYNTTQPAITNAIVKSHCPNVNHTSCCSTDQIVLVTSGLSRAEYWMGKHSKCFQMMRDMFCKFHCDVNQSETVQVLRTNRRGAITAIRVQIERAFAKKMFAECSTIWILWFRLVDKICIQRPCTMEEFFRSLGATEKMGGSSPYLIDFQFID
ncbi:hypothetical protein AAHC03_022543 [Spirometra sp. Aus1]